jgi:acyl carrier protein
MIQKTIIPIAIVTAVGAVACTPTTETKVIAPQPKQSETISKKVIQQKVTEIIVDKLGILESEVTLKAKFINDLGADSLDIVELIMEFEKEFNISVPDADAEKILTVENAVDFIYKTVNKK